MRSGWTPAPDSSPAPDAAQQEGCEPGSTLLCMGLFSRFFVQALPCAAEGTQCRGPAVIARSTLVRRSPPSGEGGCDEAIHLSTRSAMDCFAYARNDGLMRDHLDLA